MYRPQPESESWTCRPSLMQIMQIASCMIVKDRVHLTAMMVIVRAMQKKDPLAEDVEDAWRWIRMDRYLVR
jgi:hypothetical protein